ncbi:hypothetical protein [Amycolatopsis sp. NPDC051371]|uniref:hypothetical protein n=1 Tax=Amycolatopsis sp. NPDC051371 TaxID=3155800 RepID=UPI0034465689
MTEPESPPRRARTARLPALLALAAIGCLAGVGVAAAFGVEEPWTRGILGACVTLGGAAAESLRRRLGGT